MNPKREKASSFITRHTNGITDILFCPVHPDMWTEDITENGLDPDTKEFCAHCGGRCDDDCAVCFNA